MARFPLMVIHGKRKQRTKDKMKIQITPTAVKLWLSANDTENWATRPGSSWPCSQLRENRLFAEFDSNGLLNSKD